MCVHYAFALGENFTSSDKRTWDASAKKCVPDAIEIEFAADDGSYSRGYISKQSLHESLRTDFSRYISPAYKEAINKNITGVLQVARNPRYVSEFHSLASVFAVQIASHQVLGRRYAIFFSAARLTRLGLP
ncbi:MAG: hypothetical protein ACXV8Q_04290 [Methylobacter sp.]